MDRSELRLPITTELNGQCSNSFGVNEEESDMVRIPTHGPPTHPGDRTHFGHTLEVDALEVSQRVGARWSV
jgi:hypothetical protein